jgi:hypothetical protein
MKSERGLSSRRLIAMALLSCVSYLSLQSITYASQNQGVREAGLVSIGPTGLVSVKSSGAPLAVIARELERQTGIEVKISSQQAANLPVTVNVNAVDVGTAMETILKGTSYMSLGNTGGKSRWIVMASLENPIVPPIALAPERLVTSQASTSPGATVANGKESRDEPGRKSNPRRSGDLAPRQLAPPPSGSDGNKQNLAALPQPPGSEFDSSNPATQSTLDAYVRARDVAMANRAERVLSSDAGLDAQNAALRDIAGNSTNEAQAVWSSVVSRIGSINDSNAAEAIAMAVWRHATQTGFSQSSESLLTAMQASQKPAVQSVAQRAISDMLQYRASVAAVRR